jgi:hypothetical protein
VTNRKLLAWLTFAVLLTLGIAGLLAWAGLRWLEEHFALHDVDVLYYRGGLRFTARENEDYHMVDWHAEDWRNLEACPLAVRAPEGGEFGAIELGDFDGLKAKGWSEFKGGDEIELYSDQRIIRCWFRERHLIHVEVNTLSIAGQKPPAVSIAVFGKTVSLPASEQTIIEALGPPLKKKPAAKGSWN